VNHARHYTVEQANAALGWVRERLDRLRAARRAFVDEDTRAALAEAATTNGGGTPGRAVSQAFLDLNSTAADFQQMDIVVRDVSRGLVDFPAVRDGREVYLCWEDGEDEVSHWHEVDGGYGGRRKL
jgi:hypothetical protein